MKPYTVQAQLYGTLAVLTFCLARRPPARGGAPTVVDVPAVLPPRTDCLVLDLDHADGSGAEGLVVVRDWARARAVFVAVLYGGTRGAVPFSRLPYGPAATVADPGPGHDAEPDDPVAVAVARLLMVRRELRERADGIRRARHGTHPCSGP
ncbi:hypothetical protein [Streptomyces sp. RerS4]|uniref:hypothetical protein n=1 Tax=Streptomyces sp. RerS4 TaxID=2942449 RepID=UPI00201BCB74|nr:hypothetical protein [Streptomyces sp. RerS4]UQW99503.1 hypothetical protein M4D82_02370 [Streptomyces sp. RerS4]